MIDSNRLKSTSITKLALKIALLAILLILIPTAESPAIAQIQNAIIDLSISRNATALSASKGDNVEWQLQVTLEQADSSGVEGVIVNEILSSELQLVTTTPSQGSCHATSETGYTCDLGHLGVGVSATIDVVSKISDSPSRERFTSTAYVSNRTGKVDPVLDNNVSILNIIVIEDRDLSNLLVSPLCTSTNGRLLITGEGLLGISEDGIDARVGGESATALLLGNTSLSLIVPDLEPGTVSIEINGLPLDTRIQIDPGCGIKPIDAAQLRSDIVPGELMIFFKEDITQAEIDQFREEYGFETFREYPLLGFHHGRLPEEVLNPVDSEESNELCSSGLRSRYPMMNLIILADISGTMDSVQLRRMMSELIDTLDCAINPEARVGLMTYSSGPELVLPMEPWDSQRRNFVEWINGPIAIGGLSDLTEALLATSSQLSELTEPNVDRNVFLLTRGLSLPGLEDVEDIELAFRSNQIALSGIAFTNIFFGRNHYAELEDLVRSLGRPLYYFDERMPHEIGRVAVCSVVSGLYNIQQCGPKPLEQIPLIPQVQVDPTERIMDLIASDFRIDQVCLNTLVEHEQFEDPQVGDQTWLQQLGMENIASYFPRLGDGVTIALIDTGVDLTVSEMGEIVINPGIPEGLSFATGPNDSGNASDVVGHGTKVASVSAATGNNGLNGIGVAPRANVVPIRVFANTDSGVKGNSLWVAEAIASAYLMGVDVINLSLGDRSRVNVGCQKVSSRDYYERVFGNLQAIAEEAGLSKMPIVVAATGNDGRRVRCPACVESVIAVGSVRLNDEGVWERSPFSNYGDEIDFVAEGDHILTTLQGGEFGDTGPGTSFSAPQVTGLIALMLAENPNLTTPEVVEKIKTCFSEDLLEPGWDEETGWGRIVIPAPSGSSADCSTSSD